MFAGINRNDGKASNNNERYFDKRDTWLFRCCWSIRKNYL